MDRPGSGQDVLPLLVRPPLHLQPVSQLVGALDLVREIDPTVALTLGNVPVPALLGASVKEPETEFPCSVGFRLPSAQ